MWFEASIWLIVGSNGVYLTVFDWDPQITVSPKWRLIAFLIIVPATSHELLTSNRLGGYIDHDRGWPLARNEEQLVAKSFTEAPLR